MIKDDVMSLVVLTTVPVTYVVLLSYKDYEVKQPPADCTIPRVFMKELPNHGDIACKLHMRYLIKQTQVLVSLQRHQLQGQLGLGKF